MYIFFNFSDNEVKVVIALYLLSELRLLLRKVF